MELPVVKKNEANAEVIKKNPAFYRLTSRGRQFWLQKEYDWFYLHTCIIVSFFLYDRLYSVEDVGLQFSSPEGYLLLEQNRASWSQNSPVDTVAMVTNGCRQAGVRWWRGRRPDQLAVQGRGGEVCAAVVEEWDEGMERRLQRRTSFTCGNPFSEVRRWGRHNCLLQHLQVIVCPGRLVIHM